MQFDEELISDKRQISDKLDKENNTEKAWWKDFIPEALILIELVVKVMEKRMIFSIFIISLNLLYESHYEFFKWGEKQNEKINLLFKKIKIYKLILLIINIGSHKLYRWCKEWLTEEDWVTTHNPTA